MRDSQALTATQRASCLLPDVELLWLIARRDQRAMEVLFERQEAQVSRFALRLLKDGAMAEDIASETFCQVWQGAAATFRNRSEVQAWLLAIARNLALATRRRRLEQELDDVAAEILEDPAESPEAVFTRMRQRALVARCVNDLPPAHRDLIRSFYFDDMSVGETAERVGAPANTVKPRMVRARLLMAQLLRQIERERAGSRPNAKLGTVHVDLRV
jgi:RNA polymerase sigma-70 factor, ECF subfamily